jgi:integrase
MGRKKIPGLVKRGECWHIDKQISGKRICESTGTGDLEEAERYLARRIEEIRRVSIYGHRPDHTFLKAATKYLNDGDKRSLDRDAPTLKIMMPYIGHLPLNQVHMGTLEPYIAARKQQGTKSGTINRDLAVVRRILNLSARLWRNENGLTWLENAPLLQMLSTKDARKPYPLSWEEQELLFPLLPEHIRKMALFKVNTGTREQEVCCLRWEWEIEAPELNTSIFLVPGEIVKNGEDRLIVLNQVAYAIVNEQRGKHPDLVFSYKGEQLAKMHTSAWNRARAKAAKAYPATFGKACPDGFRNIRVHDLKHTFGRRLRAAGVSFEDRQDLLGHKNGKITSHYSAAEIGSLIEAANKVCVTESRKSHASEILRRALGAR